MSATIPTKDVGEVKVRKCCGDSVWQLEDGIEEWAKIDGGIRDGR